MTLRDQIAQQALSLPPEDRLYVADVLEHSLTIGEFATPEIAAQWAAEIERRIEAYDRGDMHAAAFDTVLDRIRQHLAEHRNRKVNP
jgi:putative addiction module component (TIGR02574 family)